MCPFCLEKKNIGGDKLLLRILRYYQNTELMKIIKKNLKQKAKKIQERKQLNNLLMN